MVVPVLRDAQAAAEARCAPESGNAWRRIGSNHLPIVSLKGGREMPDCPMTARRAQGRPAARRCLPARRRGAPSLLQFVAQTSHELFRCATTDQMLVIVVGEDTAEI